MLTTQSKSWVVLTHTGRHMYESSISGVTPSVPWTNKNLSIRYPPYRYRMGISISQLYYSYEMVAQLQTNRFVHFQLTAVRYYQTMDQRWSHPRIYFDFTLDLIIPFRHSLSLFLACLCFSIIVRLLVLNKVWNKQFKLCESICISTRPWLHDFIPLQL